jgi:UMF1 family MFS transporter
VLFDWATQPFYTLVVTFLFAPYFVNGFIRIRRSAPRLWAYATGGAELIAALLAPILGSIADAGFPAKTMDRGISVLLVVACAAYGSLSRDKPASRRSCFSPSLSPSSGLSSPPCSTTP